jgi:glycosyltransferase involved in cell wall biosynthesis
MKRILIFSTAYFPFVGGAEVAIKEITNRIGGDIEFDLITTRLDGNLKKVEKVGAINVYRIGIGLPIMDKLLVPFRGAILAAKLNKKNKYDFFWPVMASFASGAPYIVNIARQLLGKNKVPIVLTLQEGDSERRLKYRWLGLIDLSWKLALQRTDILTAISQYLLNRSRNFGYKGRAELIPNGVDIKKFESGQHSVLTKDKVVIVTTSRLVEKNAVGDIIESLKYLPENVELNIIGIGPLESELKLKVKSLQLEARVKFLGLIKHEDIPDYLHVSDIFIRPSLSEGMGNSFIEAMATGIPVIATPVGGIVDFLNDGETGLFCKVKDPASIAEQVKRLMGNKDLREKIVTSARKMVSEKYDWNLIAQNMKERVFNT